MRKLLRIFVWLLLVGVAHAGTKTTVAQLTAILAEMQTQKKPDDAVANRLKLLEMSEPMPEETMNGLRRFEPGPLTITQIRVLAVASAMLLPAAADLPAAPAPDRAAQVQMMHKVVEGMKRFAQVPPLHAQRDSSEFRNGPDALHFSTGGRSSMAIGDPGVAPDNPYFRLLGEQTGPVTLQSGVELPQPRGKGQDAGRLYSPQPAGGTGLLLGTIFLDAAGGAMSFARWQTVGGKQVAVFAFRVDRKKSSYHVNYCCFPTMDSTGDGMGGAGAYGVANDFVPFKSTTGYHGEFFVDPETGAVVRLIVQVEMKVEDPVKQEDTRIDYAPVVVGDRTYMVPVRQVEFSSVLLSGESFRRMSVRRSLVERTYAGFAPVK